MPISKGEFARRRNVTPARVSQWLSEGKISGAAIVGEGRGALIDEEIADDIEDAGMASWCQHLARYTPAPCPWVPSLSAASGEI